MCRWLLESNGRQIKLDVMPINDKILGFSNRWYEVAIKESLTITLPSGTPIQVVSPVYFIATKFEAFAGRGEGNYFSHDLEDGEFKFQMHHSMYGEFKIQDLTPITHCG